jgi:hypothetical protein
MTSNNFNSVFTHIPSLAYQTQNPVKKTSRIHTYVHGLEKNLLAKLTYDNALYVENIVSIISFLKNQCFAEHAMENDSLLLQRSPTHSSMICIFIWFRKHGRFFQSMLT